MGVELVNNGAKHRQRRHIATPEDASPFTQALSLPREPETAMAQKPGLFEHPDYHPAHPHTCQDQVATPVPGAAVGQNGGPATQFSRSSWGPPAVAYPVLATGQSGHHGCWHLVQPLKMPSMGPAPHLQQYQGRPGVGIPEAAWRASACSVDIEDVGG